MKSYLFAFEKAYTRYYIIIVECGGISLTKSQRYSKNTLSSAKIKY